LGHLNDVSGQQRTINPCNLSKPEKWPFSHLSSLPALQRILDQKSSRSGYRDQTMAVTTLLFDVLDHAVGTALHIIFGTTIFSSMLFVSIDDGCIIIISLMASVIVCRVILTYELAVLREKVEVAGIKE
jgi:hypothetical protein